MIPKNSNLGRSVMMWWKGCLGGKLMLILVVLSLSIDVVYSTWLFVWRTTFVGVSRLILTLCKEEEEVGSYVDVEGPMGLVLSLWLFWRYSPSLLFHRVSVFSASPRVSAVTLVSLIPCRLCICRVFIGWQCKNDADGIDDEFEARGGKSIPVPFCSRLPWQRLISLDAREDSPQLCQIR